MEHLSSLNNGQLSPKESITLHGKVSKTGKDCSITAYNESKISSAFPESSLDAQNLQIIAQTYDKISGFTLSRYSKVVKYENQKTTGAPMVQILVKNKTGIGSGEMKQALKLVKSTGTMQRSLTVSVTDFHETKKENLEKTISCTIN